MFAPTREQVRQFFFDAWAKHRRREVLVGAEVTAVDVILAHPEYHDLLDDVAFNRNREWTPAQGETNPFLHLSMHLAIEEQLAIDQPAGIRAAFDALAKRRGDRHAASHATLECLGAMMWRSQRDNAPPDGEAYVECVRRAR